MPIKSFAKKQVAVSHSTTESEMVSLEEGLRTDALQVLTFWEHVVQLFGPQNLGGSHSAHPVAHRVAGCAGAVASKTQESDTQTINDVGPVNTPCSALPSADRQCSALLSAGRPLHPQATASTTTGTTTLTPPDTITTATTIYGDKANDDQTGFAGDNTFSFIPASTATTGIYNAQHPTG